MFTTSSSGGGSNGPRYANLTKTAASGSIYSDTRVFDYEDNEPFHAQAASRDTNASATGAVSISLIRRIVGTPALTGCNEYPSPNRNDNGASHATPWTIITTVSCPPTSTTQWTGCATGNYDHDGVYPQNEYAVDMRAQFNTARSHTVQADDVRVALGNE